VVGVTDRRPDQRWPTVELDPIARLRVMSRSLPGVAMAERTFDAPFDDVWDFVSDLEASVPQIDTDVRKLRILSSDGERLRIRSWGHFLGVTYRAPDSDVELRRGWCWMHSPAYVVGMAAIPDGDRTRFAHLEGVPLGGPRFLQRSLLPVAWVSRFRHRRHVPRDLDGIERGLAARARGDL
jgi:hypothetical protein